MLLVKLVTVFILCQLAWCMLGPFKNLRFCGPGVSEQADYVPSPAWGCCAWPHGHHHLEQLRHCCQGTSPGPITSLFLFHVLFMSPLLVGTPQCHLSPVRVEQHHHFCSPPGVTLTDTQTNGKRKISGCISVLCKVQWCEILWNETC